MPLLHIAYNKDVQNEHHWIKQKVTLQYLQVPEEIKGVNIRPPGKTKATLGLTPIHLR